MTIYRIETYVIKPEKHNEYRAIMKKWLEYIKKHKQKCRELKSWKLFSRLIGDQIGGYVEMWELDSLADYEKLMNRIMQDKEFQEIISEFSTKCLVPATYTANVWNSVCGM